MNGTVEYLKAKRQIQDSFSSGDHATTAANSIGDDGMAALLEAITPRLALGKCAQMPAMSIFLFEGCRRFDRWFPPSPYVVPPSHHERFAKFVKALWQSERGDPTNCAVFQVHAFRDLVFKEFDQAAIDGIAVSTVGRYEKQIEQVPTPTQPAKKAEFEEQKSGLTAILDGLVDRSLRTVFRFRIPYVLHKQALNVNFTWRGIAMQASISPAFGPLEESSVQAGNGAALSVGASRWQTGTSLITIEQGALVDGSACTERLQALPGRNLPVDGWPKSFTLAFEIFHDLVWRLRDQYSAHQDWIPAPRDLSDLEYWIKTSRCNSLNYIKKGSPAMVVEILAPTKEQVTIDLGNLDRLPWSTECRVRSEMYLELGDTNEALFWLNVAVESLIAKRFLEIEARLGRPGLAEELGSPREFWSQAEAIVAKQFPEIAARVSWPSAPIHISIYGKLKALYRLVPMQTSVRELEHHYRRISGERNDLFHGNCTTRTTVATVENASAALSWIDINMWPRDTNSPAAFELGR